MWHLILHQFYSEFIRYYCYLYVTIDSNDDGGDDHLIDEPSISLISKYQNDDFL